MKTDKHVKVSLEAYEIARTIAYEKRLTIKDAITKALKMLNNKYKYGPKKNV